jgi:hypothetical protein
LTLTEAFRDQAISCTALGSPFMGRLFNMLADHWPGESALGQRMAAFSGDIGPSGASLPLRIGSGLHALVLSGRAPELVAVFPPHTVPEAALRRAVVSAFTAHETFLLDWVESPPQTNEVRRSAALLAGAAVMASRWPLPVWLSELGASGGLNLFWDRFAMTLPGARLGATEPVLTLSPDWRGPLPPLTLPRVAARAGVDLNPLDPSSPDDLLRLTAYLWADQPDRLALTRAAASVVDAPVERGDAIDWLDKRLKAAPADHIHLIQHTVAWQYFPDAAQMRGRALIEAAGAEATEDRPIAWLSMETDGDTRSARGAALTLRLWPGKQTLALGRADFHGRWIEWEGLS